ncbi:hypothetical protein ACFYVL_40365 [Streptomyces sp. NPDC004111]|uniref:hypothetical protein n=1 Tax=Streptomyces sp. NPDC004111 TaxID=3364690 RepID=UPI00368E9B19
MSAIKGKVHDSAYPDKASKGWVHAAFDGFTADGTRKNLPDGWVQKRYLRESLYTQLD